MNTGNEPPISSLSRRFRWLSSIASFGLLFVISVLWTVQPAELIAVLYVPVGAWAIFGIATAAFGIPRSIRSILVAAWIVFFVTLSEPVWSIPRGWFTAAVEQDIRAITVNCNVGNQAAAREVIPLRPDVVLFQETCSPSVLREIADELWSPNGNIIHTPECSIIANGDLRLIASNPAAAFVLAEWKSPSGKSHLVASLRLAPPATRLDLWTKSARQEHAERCENRSQVMETLLSLVSENCQQQELILIGGDFNTMSQDQSLMKVFASQSALRFKDSFRSGGVNWGDTVLNDFPFQRFDQIWLSQPTSRLNIQCRAIRTANSDHRLVLCDISG